MGCLHLHRRDPRFRPAVVRHQGPQPHRHPEVARGAEPRRGRRSGTRCLTGTFDYVIAGGGTAGCVLAARLSEDPDVTVCLVEAGPTDVGDDNILPLSEWMHLLDSGYDWDYPVEPQERGNSFMRHARAKVLGGCSSHNSCIAFHPPAECLDEWVEMGADGLERRRNPAAGQAIGDQRRAGRPRPRRPGPAAGRAAERPLRGRGARGGGAWPACRRWRSTAARRCTTGRAGSRSTSARTAPACRPRTPTCIRSSTPQEPRGPHRLLGVGDPVRRREQRHRGALPAARPDRLRHGVGAARGHRHRGRPSTRRNC